MFTVGSETADGEKMAETIFDAKDENPFATKQTLDCHNTCCDDDQTDHSRITGTWVNKDKLAFGQLNIHTLRFYGREGEVSMDCSIGQGPEKFFGFYYPWPNNRYYLVLQKAENGLKEYYMFVTLEKGEEDGSEYLVSEMTGSIRYTHQKG